MEGRLRFLAHQSDLTTVTVTARQPARYSPPERTTFSTTVRRAFQGSLQAMADLGQALVLGTVAALPWIALGSLIGIPLSRRWRARRRHLSGSASSE